MSAVTEFSVNLSYSADIISSRLTIRQSHLFSSSFFQSIKFNSPIGTAFEYYTDEQDNKITHSKGRYIYDVNSLETNAGFEHVAADQRCQQ